MNVERDARIEGLALEEVLRAAEKALENGLDIPGVILAASNSLPANASEFDRGLAAGFALARFLGRKPV